ncbi:MAG: hypothetical protein COZ80_01125 [Ignavibacteria bacterium CG_4_8_14_3_um_filter_37_9]|nr:MAG: hypothetical protein COZ80_01125 [Ignavibacteria bacterium CG_4_8_14_3_um_filter_37_9]PIX94774.1 MAG: hypothetical protein COZ25_03855 [Ignavibacteria bacterium CG_4_10_14_3_um_filter_37_18]
MSPIFFSNTSEFRKWVDKNHKWETELFVRYYKVKISNPSMTWSQSVEQEICFGWIHGVSKSLGEESYWHTF